MKAARAERQWPAHTHTEEGTDTPSPARPSGQGVPGLQQLLVQCSQWAGAPSPAWLAAASEVLMHLAQDPSGSATNTAFFTDGRGSRCQRSKSIPKISASRNGVLEPLPRGSLRSGGGRFLEKFPAHISCLTQALFPPEFKHERREDKLRPYVHPRPQTAAKLKLYDKKNLRLVFFLNSEISSRCLHIK